jgi:ribosome maturation factor RimP
VSALQTEIEARLAGVEPEVEVLLAEVVAGSTLRLFIDHPSGVTLALCERVTGHLTEYRERYSLEVSSPGQDRPLTKPQHYSRFLGRRARVRLRQATDAHQQPATSTRQPASTKESSAPAKESPAPATKSLVGELVGASDRDVTIAANDGIVTIPYEQIARSNLVPGD